MKNADRAWQLVGAETESWRRCVFLYLTRSCVYLVACAGLGEPLSITKGHTLFSSPPLDATGRHDDAVRRRNGLLATGRPSGRLRLEQRADRLLRADAPEALPNAAIPTRLRQAVPVRPSRLYGSLLPQTAHATAPERETRTDEDLPIGLHVAVVMLSASSEPALRLAVRACVCARACACVSVVRCCCCCCCGDINCDDEVDGFNQPEFVIQSLETQEGNDSAGFLFYYQVI